MSEDTRKPLAERMYESGFTDLIPVIPPGAVLAPSSKIAPNQIGKIPGRRLDNGLWAGFDWRKLKASIDDVRTWHRWGANVGLRADQFPGVDIDCADPSLAEIIERAALEHLGPAPVRVGNPPKRLLPYRAAEPFGRMRLWLRKHDASYLVEILGAGQQYLVAGTHPVTQRQYEWSADPAALGAAALSELSRSKASAFLDYLAEAVEMLGYETKRMGDGTLVTHAPSSNQAGLEAPSVEELRQAVALIPNSNTMFPGWDEYVKMLYAIRAAAGPNDEEGYEVFSEWASRWDGGTNDPDAVRSLWRRTHGPYVIGWSWLAELARQYGYNDAMFPTEEPQPEPTSAEKSPRPPYLSDQWLAVKVVEETQGVLRFVPASERWLVWDGKRWQPDAAMLAEDTVKLELRNIARRLIDQSREASAKEQQAADKSAKEICSAGKCSAVRILVQSDRAIAVRPESLDFNPWLLNTPNGIVDLKTGRVLPPNPDELMTKTTSVAPDFDAPMPEWTRFLDEATGGDLGLQTYLQRLTGYALTGETIEHQYTFIYGPGGNGKGKFLEAITGILGDYATAAPMDTFVASANERHATELAGLQGARLVTASETDAGKRWDEPKLKMMTGGDPIRARFMHEDYFTYQPQFKLIFIGNHKPEIRNLDKAMRRRTHLVPFTVTPKVEDKLLGRKLREEWPAILAWMIQGCLDWQKEGLQPPTVVLEATEEYFHESDPVGQWLDERTVADPGGWVELIDLFDSWREWCNRRGEKYVGKIQRLGTILQSKNYPKRQHSRTRRVEFGGIKLLNRQDTVEALLK